MGHPPRDGPSQYLDGRSSGARAHPVSDVRVRKPRFIPRPAIERCRLDVLVLRRYAVRNHHERDQERKGGGRDALEPSFGLARFRAK